MPTMRDGILDNPQEGGAAQKTISLRASRIGYERIIACMVTKIIIVVKPSVRTVTFPSMDVAILGGGIIEIEVYKKFNILA